MSLEWEDKRGKGKQWKKCDIGYYLLAKKKRDKFICFRLLAKGPFHLSYTF